MRKPLKKNLLYMPLGSEEDQYINVNILTSILLNWASLMAQMVKNLPAMQEI